MRPLRLLVLATCLSISSASPISESDSRNITVRHEKRKRLRGDLIPHLYTTARVTHVRNSEKHLLVYNRTMQIFGEREQQILKDSRRWRVKHSSNKGDSSPSVDIGKILKDKSDTTSDRKMKISDARIYSLTNRTRMTVDHFSDDSGSNFARSTTFTNRSAQSKSIKENPISNGTASVFETGTSGSLETSVSESNFVHEQNTSKTSSESDQSLSKSNDGKNESETDSIKRLDLNYNLEMLNLRDYGSEGGQLSSILRDLLERLSSSDVPVDEESMPPCQMWADCRWKLQEVLIGSLPSCPCIYPSVIFYEDSIWDENNQKFYRWKDASGSSERLDVYKPSAKHCVRSIASGLYSIAAQHCCYDRDHKLLTRGSGAGSPNLVSPDISPLLHYRIDILPWHHCKGDFTRYNKVRQPNNGNKCPLNPLQEEYQRQVELATSF